MLALRKEGLMDKRVYTYHFKNKDDGDLTYEVAVDAETFQLVYEDDKGLPSWTKLEYEQCAHCPLIADKHPSCPVAKSLHKLISTFESTKSIEVCEVVVEVPERVYSKNTDIQTGLGSLFGLIMASSACPSLGFLRPMARFHLPFASMEETIFRSVGNILIEFYLDGDISKDRVNETLKNRYAEVNSVNQYLIKRIDHLIKSKDAGDADQNAIVVLDTLAVLLTMELGSNMQTLKDIYREVSAV